MTQLFDNFSQLSRAHDRRHNLVQERLSIERQARAISGQTSSRAKRLVADAVLSLISRGEQVDAASMLAEIQGLATPAHHHAVELCRDWLEL